jgi:hypothetical protein
MREHAETIYSCGPESRLQAADDSGCKREPCGSATQAAKIRPAPKRAQGRTDKQQQPRQTVQQR